MLPLSHLSNVMPFPTMTTGGEVDSPPRYSTSTNLSSSREPWDTERKAPIFCDSAQALSLQSPQQECHMLHLCRNPSTRHLDRFNLFWTGRNITGLVNNIQGKNGRPCFECGCHMCLKFIFGHINVSTGL